MKTQGAAKQSRSEAALTAEAGAWLARLHGPKRTREVEEGFRDWLSESAEHAAAFEHMTDTWEKSVRLYRRPAEQIASWQTPGFRMSFSRAAIATAMVAVLAVVGTIFYLHSDAVATTVGEQRILTLEDGTRVFLNTATRAVVHYDKTVRRVELDQGEALFDVAKRPDWPFIVVAGDRQIRALGTSFIVRREEQSLAVTLVEGKVTVAPINEEPGTTPPLSNSSPSALEKKVPATREGAASSKKASDSPTANNSVEVFTLTPGQRLTFASSRAPRLDRPAVDKMTAWQRGQVALDNVSLAEAVAEMNRYSRIRLQVESPQAASIRISGIFRSGDSANFAQAVAKTYNLTIVNQPREIILTTPQPPTDMGIEQPH